MGLVHFTHQNLRAQFRLQQLGCPIAWGNHFLIWATTIYRRIAQPGKFKSVSLHQSYHVRKLQTSKINMFWLFPLHIYRPSMFCYSGKFGQAVIWLSLPNRATKKKGNSCSLVHMHLLCLISLAISLNQTALNLYNGMDMVHLPNTKTFSIQTTVRVFKTFYMQLPNCLHDKVKDEKIN